MMSLVTGSGASWLILAALSLTAVEAVGMGEILGQAKEQHGLKYDVTVYDHGTGRVTVTIKIADEGRMAPLKSVELHIPSDDTFKDGGHMADLVLSIATTKENGKVVARVHLRKDWAQRAKIWLSSLHFDGKRLPFLTTSVSHIIPVAKYMTNTPALKNPSNPTSESSKVSVVPAVQLPTAEQKQ